MTQLVGLDVGTTGVKALALSPAGDVLARAEETYELSMPRPGWAEQDPEDWWRAAERALARLGGDATAIGLSGQMHGLVVLDDRDRVLRPAILFGERGVLINNIAWLLRHLPVFAVGGRGDYRVRGIHVEDLARLCVEAAQHREDSVIDAVGPERPTFLELVEWIRRAVHSRARIAHVPGGLVPILSRGLGLVLRDVLLTRDEYRAMADGLADTEGPATGRIALSSWLAENGESLGTRYRNELDLHFR